LRNIEKEYERNIEKLMV